MTRSLRGVAVALLWTLALAACGGDDSSSTASSDDSSTTSESSEATETTDSTTTTVPATDPGQCGPEPSGTAADGRKLQAIVFDELGTDHRWPDNEAELTACATSSLEVTYELEDEGGNCELAATAVRAANVPAECTVVARQDGNDEYAPAEEQRQPYNVDRGRVTLQWKSDPEQQFEYTDGGDNVETVTITVSSPPKVIGRLDVDASGACEAEDKTVNGGPSIDIDIPVTILDPSIEGGLCFIEASFQQEYFDGNDLLPREYPVTAG